MYVKMCETKESQAVIVNRALEQYFTPSETLHNKTKPEDDHFQSDYLLQVTRITDITARLEEKDHRITDLQEQIRVHSVQLETKDTQIGKLTETMQAQAIHIQTLLNQKQIEAPGTKKPWWRVW